jgi:hypothetical protein
VTEVRRPALPAGAGGLYQKLHQPASGVRDGRRLRHHRPHRRPHRARSRGATGVSDSAYRATDRREGLIGTDGSSDVVAAAAAEATVNRTVNSDIHADREPDGHGRVFTRRATEAALARAT